jgi:hypothetical protein
LKNQILLGSPQVREDQFYERSLAWQNNFLRAGKIFRHAESKNGIERGGATRRA